MWLKEPQNHQSVTYVTSGGHTHVCFEASVRTAALKWPVTHINGWHLAQGSEVNGALSYTHMSSGVQWSSTLTFPESSFRLAITCSITHDEKKCMRLCLWVNSMLCACWLNGTVFMGFWEQKARRRLWPWRGGPVRWRQLINCLIKDTGEQRPRQYGLWEPKKVLTSAQNWTDGYEKWSCWRTSHGRSKFRIESIRVCLKASKFFTI